MEALDKLIEAVEAGVEPTYRETSTAIGDAGDSAVDKATQAYHGSLNAALAVHVSLLPGWDWLIEPGGWATVYKCGAARHQALIDSRFAGRAWLLAALKAYRSTQP